MSGCLTQRGKLKATKCRRHVASDIEAMQHWCHYIWRLPQYKRRWKKKNLQALLTTSEHSHSISATCLCVYVCVSEWAPLKTAVRMKAIALLESIGLILRQQGAESRWKRRWSKRGKYTVEWQRPETQGATSRRPLYTISSWSTWHLN